MRMFISIYNFVTDFNHFSQKHSKNSNLISQTAQNLGIGILLWKMKADLPVLARKASKPLQNAANMTVKLNAHFRTYGPCWRQCQWMCHTLRSWSLEGGCLWWCWHKKCIHTEYLGTRGDGIICLAHISSTENPELRGTSPNLHAIRVCTFTTASVWLLPLFHVYLFSGWKPSLLLCHFTSSASPGHWPLLDNPTKKYLLSLLIRITR